MLKTKTSLVKSATVSLTETVGPLCTEKKKKLENVLRIISQTEKAIVKNEVQVFYTG